MRQRTDNLQLVLGSLLGSSMEQHQRCGCNQDILLLRHQRIDIYRCIPEIDEYYFFENHVDLRIKSLTGQSWMSLYVLTCISFLLNPFESSQSASLYIPPLILTQVSSPKTSFGSSGLCPCPFYRSKFMPKIWMKIFIFISKIFKSRYLFRTHV